MQSDDTTKEWNVAAALYKNGTDIKSLMEGLKGMKRCETENIVSRHRLRAKMIIEQSSEVAEKEEPIYVWQELLHNCEILEGTSKTVPNSLYLKKRKKVARSVKANRYTHLLGNNFMYAAHFEEHFRGETDNDPDYSEIYRYLGQLLNGEAPTQLKPRSAAKVLKMFTLICGSASNKENARVYKSFRANLAPSCLEAGANIINIAKDKQNINANTVKMDTSYPLNEADLQLNDYLEDCDQATHHISHNLQMLKKISEKQMDLGTYLRTVPGFNPLEMGKECLARPSAAALFAQKEFSKDKTT